MRLLRHSERFEMNAQSKALRLADFLEQNNASKEAQNHVAYELRRLHEANQELENALQTMLNNWNQGSFHPAVGQALDAIAKSKGGKA